MAELASADHRIDTAAQIVFLTLTGRVTVLHLREMQQRARSDPDFSPDLGILMDLRKADLSDLVPADIRGLTGSSPAAKAAPRAVVLGGEIQEGLARLFQTFTEIDGRSSTNLFRNYAEALAWLESQLQCVQKRS